LASSKLFRFFYTTYLKDSGDVRVIIELGVLLTLLLKLILPLLRIGAFMLSSPIFSVDAVSLRFRISIAVVLSVLVINVAPIPEYDPLSANGVLFALIEVFIGLMMGFVLQIVSAAFTVGGSFISNSMGLSFANIVDPGMGNVPVVSQFFILLATLVFLAINGHLLLMQVLIESFITIPIGNYPDLSGWFDILWLWTPKMFIAGVALGLPVVIALLIINLGLGIVTRAAPAMNIFSIGFPALLIGGLILILVALPSIGTSMEALWTEGVDTINRLLGI
jgi:flagellar biosynthetic protein FliR